MLAHSGPRRLNVQADFKAEEDVNPCEGTKPARSFGKSLLRRSILIAVIETTHAPANKGMVRPSFRHEAVQTFRTTIDSDVRRSWPRSFLFRSVRVIKGFFPSIKSEATLIPKLVR